MIKLTHLNKIYNKNRADEIHAINDVSLELPSTGLVALFGPSGSGKTTLLNVISGLDKANGTINIDNHEIKKYSAKNWDAIRNEYIGYIFQNYNLFEELSVYENISMALNMIGIYDKEVINSRVKEALKAVNMEHFGNRLAKALSGGQQQRVAIARALVKSPRIIIADEPTGNLDSTNTIAIMNIIKKISTKCLVVLVTHEASIVNFYADRIIEIKDGKVDKDYLVTATKTLDVKDDKTIYLQDLTKDSEVISNLNIDYFYDEKLDKDIKLSIIYRNGTIYIQNTTDKRIKLVDKNDSDIVIKDEKYKKISKKEIIDNTFEISALPNVNRNYKKGVIRFSNCLKSGFIKFARAKAIRKLLSLSFVLVSALTVYNLASFGANYNIDESSIYTVDNNIVSVVSGEDKMKSIDYDTAMKLATNIPSISAVLPTTSQATISIMLRDTYQTTNIYDSFNAYFISSNYASSYKIIKGRMIENDYEIVLDKYVMDKILDNYSIQCTGFNSYDKILGQTVIVSQYQSTIGGEYLGSQPALKIVGICETNSNIAIVSEKNANLKALNINVNGHSSYYGEQETYLDKSLAPSYTIVAGHDLNEKYDILVPASMMYDHAINEIYKVGEVSFNIVGFYKFNDNINSFAVNYIINSNDVYMAANKNYINGNFSTVYFYSTDKAITVNALTELGYSAHDEQTRILDKAIENRDANMLSTYAFYLVILIATLVYIYFMMRTSMISRIKEIGYYRCLGAKKKDICKIFIGEIFATSILTTLPGYLAMTYVVNKIQNAFGTLMNSFYFPFSYFIVGLVFLFAINIIFGLIPVLLLLRKTPSEIVSKYDI